MRETSIRLGLSKTIDGRRCIVHWHMTRKWFLSCFSLAANKDVAGHEGHLSRSCRRYNKKQNLKQYAKAKKKNSVSSKDTNTDNGLGGI